MWWKPRSPKEKEKLGEATCIRVNPVDIDDHAVCVSNPEKFCGAKFYLSKEELDRFAISDGFDNWQELIDFFEHTHGLPFEGDLIEWDAIKTPF